MRLFLGLHEGVPPILAKNGGPDPPSPGGARRQRRRLPGHTLGWSHPKNTGLNSAFFDPPRGGWGVPPSGDPPGGLKNLRNLDERSSNPVTILTYTYKLVLRYSE